MVITYAVQSLKVNAKLKKKKELNECSVLRHVNRSKSWRITIQHHERIGQFESILLPYYVAMVIAHSILHFQ